jgi:hypothetical protein
MKATLALAALATLLPLNAATVLITFEGEYNTTYGAPIVRSGFTIGNVVGDEQHFHEITSTDYGLPNNGTGILLNDRDTRIFVEAGGTGFYLDSVDVATALNNYAGTGITISGYYLGGLTGSFSSLIDGSYVNLLGASLGMVDRLVFDGTGDGGGFVLDNLALTDTPGQPRVVPEPGTALMLAGAFAMALLARKRRLS